jgi:outer membrane biosynthesis protein TonB
MRNRLTVRATLVLVAFAFGVAFAIQPLQGGESSAEQPTVQDRAGVVTDAPGPDVALSLGAARQVPALRDARRKKRPVRAAPTVAPTATSTPTPPAATASPTPATAPPAPPAPPPTPRPTPAAPEPTPAPTSTPPDSGEFDTTGEP